MSVIRVRTFSDIRELGSQRKISVVRPQGIMPDLSFKAPTCLQQGFKFLFYTARWVFYLAVAPVIDFVTWIVKVSWDMDNYKYNNQVLRPREKYFDSLSCLKFNSLYENLKEVNLKYSRKLNNLIMLPLM